ncbi:hypothetical protein [Streptomyces sp. CRN 30]|uniref:hypothetical protein n=1 Tax=Streptomyces sp. CRN 30 TaxID=3075613 RepID=UPI002A7F8787|nr:hypothetical protein [Streptomyces sp. CRN 30]
MSIIGDHHWTGGVMANLDMFWLIHTTSVLENSDTEDKTSYRLIFTPGPQPDAPLFLPFPRPLYDDREKGRTDQFRFNIDQSKIAVSLTSLHPSNFTIITSGKDMWLPESIWLIGRDVNGGHRLIVSRPFWPSHLKFSEEESDDGAGQHRLDEV